MDWDRRGRAASDLQILSFLLPLLPSPSSNTAPQRAATVEINHQQPQSMVPLGSERSVYRSAGGLVRIVRYRRYHWKLKTQQIIIHLQNWKQKDIYVSLDGLPLVMQFKHFKPCDQIQSRQAFGLINCLDCYMGPLMPVLSLFAFMDDKRTRIDGLIICCICWTCYFNMS